MRRRGCKMESKVLGSLLAVGVLCPQAEAPAFMDPLSKVKYYNAERNSLLEKKEN